MSDQLNSLSTTFSIVAARVGADVPASVDNAHVARHYRDEYCRLAGVGTTQAPSVGTGPLQALDQSTTSSTVNLVYSTLPVLVRGSSINCFFGL